MLFGLVVTFYEADPYTIIIIQNSNGKLINLKIEKDD
tara:strand:- start:137 stop:247 length:111 start_codon:yes stop_codon:yes gene_type:complete